jgi:hypothetical protein
MLIGIVLINLIIIPQSMEQLDDRLIVFSEHVQQKDPIFYYPGNYDVDEIIHNAYSYEMNIDQPDEILSIQMKNNNAYSENDTMDILNNSGCTKHNLSDIILFLLDEPAITRPYVVNKYDCTQYTEDIVNNATRNGILAFPVNIDYENLDGSHAVIGFPTYDKGLVYIDGTGSSGNNTYRTIDYKIMTNLTHGKNMGSTRICSRDTYNDEYTVNGVPGSHCQVGKIKLYYPDGQPIFFEQLK